MKIDKYPNQPFNKMTFYDTAHPFKRFLVFFFGTLWQYKRNNNNFGEDDDTSYTGRIYNGTFYITSATLPNGQFYITM